MSDGQPMSHTKDHSSIDWVKVRANLETARTAIEHIWTPRHQETKRVLKARAAALAQEPTKQRCDEDCIEVVEFIVSNERFAVESRYVREVFPLENLTPVPCTPGFVLGIVNVRREILSVIDIKKFFELPTKGLTDLNKIVILQLDDMLVGVLADVIVGVRGIPTAAIQPLLPTLTEVEGKYIKGITDEQSVILNVPMILTDPRIIVNEEVRV